MVSGLALNFVPDPRQAAAEFARVARSGGIVAAYVWDYADGMAMMRYFWEADAGLEIVRVHAIDVPTVFTDFDDYWKPFLGGQGPAPGYAMSLTEGRRSALLDLLRERLPSGPDGSIPLTARARAVRGVATDFD